MEKGTIKTYAEKVEREDNEVIMYETKLVIPEDFGGIGAVLVVNEHNKEMFVKDIVIHGIPTQPHLHFACNSWIQSNDNRVFFTTKVKLNTLFFFPMLSLHISPHLYFFN